jgi:hypothetical protein
MVAQSRGTRAKICATATAKLEKRGRRFCVIKNGDTSERCKCGSAVNYWRKKGACRGDLRHSINLTKEDGPAVVGAKNLLDAEHLRDEQSHGDRQLVHRAQSASQIQRRDFRNVHRH